MKSFSYFLRELFTHWSYHPDADYVLGGIASFVEDNPGITGEQLHNIMDESPFHQNASLFRSMNKVAGGKWTVDHTKEALDLIRRKGI